MTMNKRQPLSLGVSIVSFFQNMFQPNKHSSKSPLGMVWQGEAAARAFQEKELVSVDPSLDSKDRSLRLCLRNCTPSSLLLCWVDSKGQPHHFYEVDPATIVSGKVQKGDRTETTRVGDAFLLAVGSTSAIAQARSSKSLQGLTVMGGYRACAVSQRGKEKPRYPVHILTIEERLDRTEEMCCCSPRLLLPRFFLRGSSNKPKREDTQDDEDSITWCLEVCQGEMDLTPLDTTGKRYDSTTLGGWPVRCEPDWNSGDDSIRDILAKDLEHAISCLPPHAREALRPHTPMWINKSLKYGPEVCPTTGKGLCYHPDVEWLQENGCSREKAKCVELYTAKDYMEDRGLWGRGGVLIHEYSHAYHHKCLPDGYDNADIQKCYQAAMKEGLYDKVRVHGRQGPTAKAYACENCMEYFAELSAAFLGGTDGDEEFNKWFPFNRKQIKEHDPRAYELLLRIWKVKEDSSP